MKTKLVSISLGNNKLGDIPNVSLVPGSDCGNCTHCIKDCYARRPYKMYPKTKEAWDKNSDAARNNRPVYFTTIRDWLIYAKPAFFRWHVGGDILDQDYLDNMVAIAREITDTKFLAFTKMHHLDFSNLPPNLAVIASMWPGLQPHENVAKLPKAWLQDGAEDRVPANAIPCPGICESCGMCWALPQIGLDVVFRKHR